MPIVLVVSCNMSTNEHASMVLLSSGHNCHHFVLQRFKELRQKPIIDYIVGERIEGFPHMWVSVTMHAYIYGYQMHDCILSMLMGLPSMIVSLT